MVFVDRNRPGMGGIEVVRRIRAMGNTEQVPIAMVTGVGTWGSVQEALDEAGADLYITKPYTIDELRRRLSRAIEQIATQRQAGAEGRPAGLLTRWIGSGAQVEPSPR